MTLDWPFMAGSALCENKATHKTRDSDLIDDFQLRRSADHQPLASRKEVQRSRTICRHVIPVSQVLYKHYFSSGSQPPIGFAEELDSRFLFPQLVRNKD